MTPEQRDIVLIPVPFSDLSSSKRRPVPVLSKTTYNRGSRDVLVAAITSNLASTAPGVLITPSDLAEGSLPVNSLVRVDKLYTLSRDIIIKRYGSLHQSAFTQVLAALDDLLGRFWSIVAYTETTMNDNNPRYPRIVPKVLNEGQIRLETYALRT